MKRTLISPFPTGEGGRGDRGQKSKPKAGIASAARGKPPLRFPQWQGEPVPLGFSPLRTPQRQGQQVPPPAQARGSGGFAPRKNPAKPLTKHGFCDILSPELHRESGVLG